MNIFQRRKQRKQLRALIHHARAFRNMREDVLTADERAGLDAALLAAEQAHREDREGEAMEDAALELQERMEELTPSCVLPGWRENFEVLVVALGVAMAFRAYFYQPFQIPTGSMQPTLYGISSREQDAPRTFDAPLFKAANWLVTGEWYNRVESLRDDKVAVLWNDDRVPGYTTVVCGHWTGVLPPESVCQKDTFLRRKLAAAGRHMGLAALDRGYDMFFLPNDVAARHVGIYRADFLPCASAQGQVAETLRKDALLLQHAVSTTFDAENGRLYALQQVFPVVLTVFNWSRGGQVEEGALQTLLAAYQVCELRRMGRAVSPAQERQVCSELQGLLSRWAEAAASGSPALPWFPLVSGCGVTLPAGQLLWSGVVTEGDFVFVNRWLWNFRAPRRGEVMVFSTQNIRGLPEGTHYIKRMCGLPGETLSLHEPELWINGNAVYEPNAIARIARREKLAGWAPPYAGYHAIGAVDPARFPRALHTSADSIQLKSDEYFAMGDNTNNSQDSHYWGTVPRRNLLGPATCVYWPFTSRRWGHID